MQDIKEIPLNKWIRLYYHSAISDDIIYNDIGIFEIINDKNIQLLVKVKAPTSSHNKFMMFQIKIEQIIGWDYLDEEDK